VQLVMSQRLFRVLIDPIVAITPTQRYCPPTHLGKPPRARLWGRRRRRGNGGTWTWKHEGCERGPISAQAAAAAATALVPGKYAVVVVRRGSRSIREAGVGEHKPVPAPIAVAVASELVLVVGASYRRGARALAAYYLSL
jgi:hypothetical protein